MNKNEYQKNIQGDVDCFKAFTWRYEWVRPYESLYSVYATFIRLNVISNDIAPKVITGGVCKTSIKPHFYDMLSLSCIHSKDRRQFQYQSCKKIADVLAPAEDIAEFPLFNEEAKTLFISKIPKYCPDCLSRGYHSWFFQYIGLKECPIHKNPLIESGLMFNESALTVFDYHPGLQTIDTAPIDKKYHEMFDRVKAVKLIRPNRYFDVNSFAKKIVDKPLNEIGEELCCRKVSKIHNVRRELTDAFKKVIYKVDLSYMSGEKMNPETVDKILQYIFMDSWDKSNLNPIFDDTFAIELQVYTSLMELKIECDKINDKLISRLLDEYMIKVQAMNNPLSFYKLFHYYTGEIWMHAKTPAYIERSLESHPMLLSRLNENDMMIKSIDDHIKFQWARLKHVAINNNYNFDIAIDSLPHLCYMIIIDTEDIMHLKRLIE